MKQLPIALLGSKFMGRAHSNAWLSAATFFDLPLEPTMAVVAARDAKATAAFAKRWGWQRSTDDWRTAIADPTIALVDVATPKDRKSVV